MNLDVPPSNFHHHDEPSSQPTFEKVELRTETNKKQTPKVKAPEPQQNRKHILNHEPVNVFNVDLETENSNLDYSDEENDHAHENIEDFSFVKHEEPTGRTVRYSQSAHMANALY